METKTYIAELLGRNLSPAQVCQLANVTPAYVSQLLSDAEFSARVDAQRIASLQNASNQESRASRVYDQYLDLEEQLLRNIAQQLPLMRTGEKVRLLQAISQKKAPPPPVAPATTVNNNLVNISLPAVAMQRFTTNANKDIVAIGDTSLTPLDSPALKKLVQAVDAEAIGALFSDAQPVEVFV